MPFQAQIHQELAIGVESYRIAEHPAAPGIPYGQEGKAGIVYQLLAASGEKRALKVFKPRFRVPALVGLSGRLAAFADLPGLAVCRRDVLTPQRHTGLLRQQPDLIYAVLMPWIEGPTWMEIVFSKRPLTAEQCLDLARSLADHLSQMEQRGVAHCDLSGPNVLLPLLAPSPSQGEGWGGGCSPSQGEDRGGSEGVALVDVEQLYGPGLERPSAVPGGASGYAHRTAPAGLWGPDADRFAGAILLAEILGWCDGRVRAATWGESYFDPDELQRDGERFRLLTRVLRERWGATAANLFEQAWHSDTLSGCATFGEWLMSLPESVPAAHVTGSSSEDVAVLMLRAGRLQREGNPTEALRLYDLALAQLAPGHPLRQEIQENVEALRGAAKDSPPQEGQVTDQPETPAPQETAQQALMAAYAQEAALADQSRKQLWGQIAWLALAIVIVVVAGAMKATGAVYVVPAGLGLRAIIKVLSALGAYSQHAAKRNQLAAQLGISGAPVAGSAVKGGSKRKGLLWAAGILGVVVFGVGGLVLGGGIPAILPQPTATPTSRPPAPTPTAPLPSTAAPASPTSVPATARPSPTPTPDWTAQLAPDKAYEDPVGYFRMRYPASWQAKLETSDSGSPVTTFQPSASSPDAFVQVWATDFDAPPTDEKWNTLAKSTQAKWCAGTNQCTGIQESVVGPDRKRITGQVAAGQIVGDFEMLFVKSEATLFTVISFMNTLEPVAVSALRPVVDTLQPVSLAAADAAVPSGGEFFADNFSTSRGGWSSGKASDYLLAYESDRYIIEAKKASMLLWATPRWRDLSDVRVAVEARLGASATTDGGFGVICRYQDSDNYYFFIVTGDFKVAIVMMRDGEQTVLGADKISLPAYQGFNALQAECRGDKLSLTVNGTMVTVNDSTLQRGNVGLVMESFDTGGVRAEFDNFRVTRP